LFSDFIILKTLLALSKMGLWKNEVEVFPEVLGGQQVRVDAQLLRKNRLLDPVSDAVSARRACDLVQNPDQYILSHTEPLSPLRYTPVNDIDQTYLPGDIQR